MEEKYKVRQWSLAGATIVPVLNVSSRVFWLELDDKALLDSYAVLQESILCDVFSQKCSAALLFDRAARRNRTDPYEEKSIVVLESKKSRHGGINVRIGWHTLKNKVNRLSLTSRSC